jgi:hypothetical protein
MVLKNVVVYLKDGRRIDISGRTPQDAVSYLQSVGVRTPADIERTVHSFQAQPARS